MKHVVIVLALFVTIKGQAQDLLFANTVNENQLSTNFRLSTELRSHYVSTRYVAQADFFRPADFFVQVSPNLILRSRFVKMHSHPTGSSSYEGKLEGSETGSITFSKYNDRTSGMIVLSDGTRYLIDQTAPGIFAISRSADNIFNQRDSGKDYIEVAPETPATLAATSVCDINSACTSPSVIDLLVVYTPQAASYWGGVNNTIANITQAVTNMTTSMTNSGIDNVSFRLVHVAQVDYTESGNFGTDLSRLSGTSDGYMDNVHALRDQYGADLVSLIIGSPTSSCGIGYLNTSTTTYSANNAFNVSLYSCVVGNYTMAHECGHNMGLRHDWYVDASSTPCEHHHGYVNQVAISQGAASPASARWRTIMSYNNQCSDLGFNCTRLNRWSNPSLSYNGDPTGRAIGNAQSSDEAYAFYRMACRVADFRPAVGSCPPPTSLNASPVMTSSAMLNWGSVTGAISFDADYKLSSSSSWINIATGTTATSLGVNGLSPLTSYDWRVRTNCASSTSSYSTAQFTTLATPSCSSPGSLSSSNITISAATISWGAVNGSLSYDVDYKSSSSGTWIPAATGTSSLSLNLNGLNVATLYDWRVRANCSGLSSNYSQAQFTTATPVAPCPGPFDVSTNGTTSGAAAIPLNTDVKGTLAPKGDVDHYKFTISSVGTVTISLTTLPANYQLSLLNSSGSQIAISQNNGSTSEAINATLQPGNYFAKVFAKGNVNNATECYTLKVQTGTATDTKQGRSILVKLFPNPASDKLYVWTEGVESKASIKVFNIMGKLVMQQAASNNLTTLDVSNLSPGFYLVQVNGGTESRSVKFVKE